MKKINKIIIISLLVLVLFASSLVGIYFLTFKTDIWLRYTDPLKTQVAFMRLETLSYKDDCQKDCQQKTQEYKNIILNFMSKENELAREQIKDYILNEDVDNNFKFSLLKILREDSERIKIKEKKIKIKIPEYLIDYLNNYKKGDYQLKRNIMSVFGDEIGLNSGFLDSLVLVIKNKGNTDESRIQAIDDMNKVIGLKEENGNNIPEYRNIKYDVLCGTLSKISNESSLVISAKIKESLDICDEFKIQYIK